MSDRRATEEPARAGWSRTVREGWNRVSYRYRPTSGTDDPFGHTADDYRSWLEPLLTSLPRGSRVLDLGCGTGVPAGRILAERFAVTGVDLSDTQIRRARRLVPGARFLRADLAEVDFPAASFDAVVCFYSLFHVPREQHRAILRRAHGWLVPGGWLVAMVGRGRYEGQENRWLGSDAPMLWSQHDARTYRRWLLADGFRIVREAFVPEEDVGHELFVARRRTRGPRAGQ